MTELTPQETREKLIEIVQRAIPNILTEPNPLSVVQVAIIDLYIKLTDFTEEADSG